jgi:hypothetical protein
MSVYGRDKWLRNGEFLTLFFETVGRCSSIAVCEDDGNSNHQHSMAKYSGIPGRKPYQPRQFSLILRPFGSGLIPTPRYGISTNIFIILFLSSVTFDGIMDTTFKDDYLNYIYDLPALTGILLFVNDLFGRIDIFLETIVFLSFPLLSIVVIFIFCFLGYSLSRYFAYQEFGSSQSKYGAPLMFVDFVETTVPSLIPIAIGYHIAHYASFLLIAGQLVIPLVSDPFGIGWNIFSTAAYSIDPTIVSTKFVWYLALATIVGGHIIAVIVSHLRVIMIMPENRMAIVCQLPIVLMMVAYTAGSLWILAQPIIEY